MDIIQWKKPIRKGYTPYDSNSRTFQKRQNYEDSGKTSGCRGLEGGGEKG